MQSTKTLVEVVWIHKRLRMACTIGSWGVESEISIGLRGVVGSPVMSIRLGIKLGRRSQAGLAVILVLSVFPEIAAKVRLAMGAVMVADVQVAVHSGLSIRQALWAERPWL